MTKPRISSSFLSTNHPQGGGAVPGPLGGSRGNIKKYTLTSTSSVSSSASSSCFLTTSESLLTSTEPGSSSLALRASPKGEGAIPGHNMQTELSTRRRSSLTPTPTTRATAAAAMVGVLALAVVLLRKGRVSKARLVELLAATMGGLLSSSCCAVQLLLNSVSVGCAGFAVLDRFRPLFLCLTFSSLAYKTVAYDVRLHKNPWRSLPTWLVAVALASAPVLVRRLNRGGGLAAAAAGGGALGMGGILPPSYRQGYSAQSVRLQYRVSGMKCEACANGLKNALEALQGGGGLHLQADVLFEEGMVFLVAPLSGRGREGEKEEVAASLLLELEEGVAEVMEERGYRYYSSSTEPGGSKSSSGGANAASLLQQPQQPQQPQQSGASVGARVETEEL